MAREVAVITAEIVAAKVADTTLNAALTSGSNTAIWKLWAGITALAIHNHEKQVDAVKAEIELIAARSEFGSHEWYKQKALAFQYGDLLTIIDGVPGYAVIDESKMIVKHVSVSDGETGGLLVKVSKEVSGELVPLATAEEEAFRYYLNKTKFAGIFSSVISLTADLLKGNITLYHDGLKVWADLETELNDVVAQFLRDIEFDGALAAIKLIDAIQAVEGVIDVEITSLMYKSPGDIYKNVGRLFNPASGYIKLDSGAGGITWTPVAQ